MVLEQAAPWGAEMEWEAGSYEAIGEHGWKDEGSVPQQKYCVPHTVAALEHRRRMKQRPSPGGADGWVWGWRMEVAMGVRDEG